MNKTLIVDGMHCDACVKLVEMELVENDLELGNIAKIELADGHLGHVSLVDISDDQFEKAIDIINNIDDYSVIHYE